MVCKQIIFREHAVLRMVASRISRTEVDAVLSNHRIITEYKTDKPFPSKLLLGSANGRPWHVVVAQDLNECSLVITIYQPDPLPWNDDFSLKR